MKHCTALTGKGPHGKSSDEVELLDAWIDAKMLWATAMGKAESSQLNRSTLSKPYWV